MGNPVIGANRHHRHRYLPKNRTMPHASRQRLEGVSCRDNNAHQAECECHTGPQPAPAETHIAQYVATLDLGSNRGHSDAGWSLW